MPKQPFTPAGVLAKQTEFYLLSDAALLVIAKDCGSDFLTFMDDHFTFTTDQATYLSGMSDRAAFTIGSQIAATLTIRGSITMDPIPENEEPKRPKEIRTNLDGGTVYVDGSGTSLSGTLSVEISWQLV